MIGTEIAIDTTATGSVIPRLLDAEAAAAGVVGLRRHHRGVVMRGSGVRGRRGVVGIGEREIGRGKGM
jgi:hypothetical protein